MLAAAETFGGEPSAGFDRRFGALLRFWRAALGLSQEDLADGAGVSVRHLSFLENGRTRPSLSAVEKLADALGLGSRERAVLAQAAGYAPAFPPASRAHAPLTEDWRLILRGAEPAPTSIMSRFGRILAVNRGWAALHRAHLGDLAEGADLNALDLLLHPRGWRRFVRDWTLIASVMLTIIRQEATLLEDEAALADVRRWAETPGLPRDWPLIGARLSDAASGYSYTIATRGEDGPRFRIVHSTLGFLAADRASSLILQSAYPEDGALSLLSPVEGDPHPLCPF